MLTRDAIMAAKPPLLPLDVPEWNGQVMVRKLTPLALAELQAAKSDRYPVVAIRLCLTDLDGKPLFTAADDDWLAEKLPWDLIMRLGQTVLDFSGLKALTEDAAGN